MRIHNWIGKNSLKSTTGPKSDKIGCLYCIQNSDACSVLQISETPLAAEASSIIDVVVGRRFICCNSIRFEKGVYNYFCCKVRTFWEAHKFWKNLPYGFDVYLVNQLICQNHKEDFFKTNFECFSKRPNFTSHGLAFSKASVRVYNAFQME